jgi:hypothetical protein
VTSIRWPNEGWTDFHDKTRRERIATAAMQALLSRGGGIRYTYSDIASDAISMADALIAELDKPKEQG